jgi:acetyl-CoA carboxylase biotin carboxyl carrier protein
VTERDLSYEDLLHILQLVESSSQFSEFHLKYGDIQIDLRKHSAGPSVSFQPSAADAPSANSIDSAPRPDAAALEPLPRMAGSATPEGAVIVKSPMVGTFYRAPEQGAMPFVEVGQRVAPDTVVCIIEVMKLMSSIAAGNAGVVTQVLVNDNDAVEFGQPLIVIDPNA